MVPSKSVPRKDDYVYQFNELRTTDDRSQFKARLQLAANEFMRCLESEDRDWTLPYMHYKKAKDLAKNLSINQTTMNLINYLIGFCLNKFAVTLDDLTEAVVTLESIDKDFVQKFPAVNAVLAELHYRLCRQNYALDYLTVGMNILKKLDESNDTFYLPETNIVMKDNSPDNKIWDDIKQDCLNFQIPDHVCVHSECNNITKPYSTPSQQIYFKDPAFSDIIRIQCSGESPCSLYFHKTCWFLEKVKHLLDHQTDEMIIDNHNVQCLNKNCVHKLSVINSIGIMNSEGVMIYELRYPRTDVSKQIKEKISTNPETNHETMDRSVLNASGGAIKKGTELFKSSCWKDSKKFPTITLQLQKNSEPPKSDNDLLVPEVNGEKFGPQDYNPFLINKRPSERMSRVVVVKEGVKPEFNTPEKEFLFSYFHEFLMNNVATTWVEIYDQYMKIRDQFSQAPVEDIRDFLLSSKAFEEAPVDITSSKETVDKTSENINKMYVAHNGSHKGKTSANAYYDLLDDTDDIDQSNQASINLPMNTSKNSDAEISNFLDSNKSKAIDIDYLKKIISYSNTIEIQLQEQIETNSHLGQMVRKQAAQIQNFETERQDLWNKIVNLSNIIAASTNLKKKYDQINEENIQLKQELLEIKLEVKKAKLNETHQDQFLNKIDENKRKEIVGTFQEELKIIRDSLNNEWKERFSVIENTNIALKATNRILVSKYIDSRFGERYNLISGIMQQCYDAAAIITKINHWMKQKMQIHNFINVSMWSKRIDLLNEVQSKDKKEYSIMKKKLEESSDENINDLTEINFPLLPVSPPEHIAHFVLGALDRFYFHQCVIVQNLKMASQPQLTYPIPYNYGYHQPIIHPVMQYPTRQYDMYNYQQVPEQPRSSVNIIDVTHTNQRPSPKPWTKWTETNLNSITICETSIDKTTNVTKDSILNQTNNLANGFSLVDPSNSTSLEDSLSIESVSNQSAVNSEKSKSDPESVKIQLTTESVKTQSSITETVNAQSITEPRNTELATEPVNTESATELVNTESATESVKTQIQTISDDRSDYTNNTFRSDIKSQQPVKKKVGMEKLILIMQKKFPEVAKVDLIEVVEKIREKNNNSLSGLGISQICRESDELLLRRHRLHMLQYDVLHSKESLADINSNDISNNSTSPEISFAVL